MDVVVRTLVDTAPGRDGLVRRRVEVPRGSWVEAAAGPGTLRVLGVFHPGGSPAAKATARTSPVR